MSINEKIFLITGGARGLGKCFAKRLICEGGKVILVDLLADVGRSTEEEFNKQYPGQTLFFEGDVTNTECIKRIWEDGEKKMKGKVDVLVNNAGVLHTSRKKIIDINLMSVMELSYMAIEKMSVQNGGSGGVIINTASMAGLLDCEDMYMLPYFVSKTAVVSFTKSLASCNIMSTDGIRVSAICPYYVDTDMIIKNKENVLEVVSESGLEILTTERVTQDFLKLVNDNFNNSIPNGSIMQVIPLEEASYAIFSSPSKVYH